MSGQFTTSDPDIVWRTIIENGKWVAAVEHVHGSTRGDGWLNVWDGKDHKMIHRTKVHLRTMVLMGQDDGSVRDWEAEIIRAITHPGARVVQAY